MKDIILKLQRHKIALEPAKERLLWNEQGVIHLGAILPPVQTRSVDLHSTELLMKTMVWSGNINVPLSAILIDQKNYLSGDHASAAFVQMNPVNILLNIFHLNDLKITYSRNGSTCLVHHRTNPTCQTCRRKSLKLRRFCSRMQHLPPPICHSEIFVRSITSSTCRCSSRRRAIRSNAPETTSASTAAAADGPAAERRR